LSESGHLTRTHEAKGPFTEINCRLTAKPVEGDLSPTAVSAVEEAVRYVAEHPAQSISELRRSRENNSLSERAFKLVGKEDSACWVAH